jgi:hypothetical protein
MHLPLSQNNNVKNMCTVVKPVHMNSEQGSVYPSWDQLYVRVDCPYHPPPPIK